VAVLNALPDASSPPDRRTHFRMPSARLSFLNLAVARKLIGIASVAGLGLMLTACANYRLGTGAKTTFSTLFIAPVECKVLIPQAQVLVTTQLREAFIHDGRVTLVDSADAADAVLRVSLIGYDRTVAVAQTNDTGLGRRFDLALKAHATLTDNHRTQTYFTDRTLTATRGVFIDSGLVPAEYETLPLLAEQLANESLHAVLDVW
jgi:Lipopolysaccharide-assembly